MSPGLFFFGTPFRFKDLMEKDTVKRDPNKKDPKSFSGPKPSKAKEELKPIEVAKPDAPKPKKK